MPMRVAAGSLKRTKVTTARAFLGILFLLLMAAVASPIVLPPLLALLLAGGNGALAALETLLFSAAELTLFAILYPFALRRLGHLLQRHEKDILQAVTQEVE
jgi:hypothetical protein